MIYLLNIPNKIFFSLFFTILRQVEAVVYSNGIILSIDYDSKYKYR